jgi:hypothetical protein
VNGKVNGKKPMPRLSDATVRGHLEALRGRPVTDPLGPAHPLLEQLQRAGLTPEVLARITAAVAPPAPPAPPHPGPVENLLGPARHVPDAVGARPPRKHGPRLNGAAPGERPRPRPTKGRGPLITVRRQPTEPSSEREDEDEQVDEGLA